MNKCQGCGIDLQRTNPSGLGYINDSNQHLCERCFKLKHYGQYQQVSLSNQEYQSIINKIPKNALKVYIMDILYLDFNVLDSIRPKVLVLTKRDLLPKSVKDEKIIEHITKKYPQLLGVYLISSKKNYQIDNLYQALQTYSANKIYLIGKTNSGKSTLINCFLKNFNSQDQTKEVTVSMYPSTTLNKIQIPFPNFTLVDTPGLIDSTNIVNYLSKSDLKKITPLKEIKPKSCQVKEKGSILLDSFARIDYETSSSNSFVIYASNQLNIRFASLKSETLKELPTKTFSLITSKDIVIPGLGFIKCTKPITMTLYTLDQVVPFIRDNLI